MAHHLRDGAGDVTAGQDTPIDLAQPELRLLGGDRQIARNQRREGAAEAPAVDHRDGGLFEIHQPAPPAARLAARLERRGAALAVIVAKILLEIHAGRPGFAGTGEHHDAHIVAALEFIEHSQHADIERRVHGVALLRTVEGDGRDPPVNGDQHQLVGLAHGCSPWLSRSRRAGFRILPEALRGIAAASM